MRRLAQGSKRAQRKIRRPVANRIVGRDNQISSTFSPVRSGWADVDDPTANEQQFTLVHWRPILERFRGREVAGLVRGMGVSWQLGLQRSRGLSR